MAQPTVGPSERAGNSPVSQVPSETPLVSSPTGSSIEDVGNDEQPLLGDTPLPMPETGNRLQDPSEWDLAYRDAAAARAIRITELTQEATALRERLRRRERELADLRRELDQARTSAGSGSRWPFLSDPTSVPRRVGHWLGQHEGNPLARLVLRGARRTRAIVRRARPGRAA